MGDRRFAVIGTAGHIDHGKTALVRLLTGVDTDRLKEEKERGISIDLGFAHLSLPGKLDCGIVDVPGHERFVRNMLAGVGGIDAVLLVVAADEGVMPQTREHFDIIRLLGVEKGVVALTKIDMVEPDWLEIVQEDVKDYLAGSPFDGAPIVPVSSKTGDGRDDVLRALAAALADQIERPAGRPARLPVDRVFVVEGFGTVVTGTLWSGRIRTGDRVLIEPNGLETRVRSVQVHGEDVAEAVAGQRTAVALHGIEKAKIARGDWVLAPGSLSSSYMVDARVRLVKDMARPLVNRQRIRFHLGASETLGRVVLLDEEELAAGESAVVQLRLESPVVCARGDRFVIRSYSPQRAIGGGTVLVPNPDKHKRHDSDAVARLEIEEGGGAAEKVAQALASFKESAPVDDVARSAGLGAGDAEEALKELRESGIAVRLTDSRWLSREHFATLGAQVVEACERYQSGGPFRWGYSRGELKSQLPRSVDAVLFDALVDDLCESDRLFRRGDRFRAGSEELSLTDRQSQILASVLATVREAGASPPSLKELDAKTGAGNQLAGILGSLVVDGKLVKVTTDLYYATEALADMERRVRVFFSKADEMRVSDLKEMFGLSRRHGIPVLEYFDRGGVTRRVGDVRVAGRLLTAED